MLVRLRILLANQFINEALNYDPKVREENKGNAVYNDTDCLHSKK